MEQLADPTYVQTSGHQVDVSRDLTLLVAVAVVVLGVALALVLTVQHVHPVPSVTTAAPTSPAMQTAQRVCQYDADHANTRGVIEPVGIAQVRDQVYGTCMADHGFPLGP